MPAEYSTEPDDGPPAIESPRADPEVVRARWEHDRAAAQARRPAPQRVQEEARGSLRDILADVPRPSLLGLVGAAHAVFVVATFWYLAAELGWIYALGAGAVYTLAWTVVLVNRADERRRLNRAPAPFRKYDYAPPPGEDS